MAQGGGDRRASDESDEHRDRCEKAAQKALGQDDGGQRSEGVEQRSRLQGNRAVGGRSRRRGGGVSDEVGGRNRQQGRSHDEEDRARDHGREEADEGREIGRGEEREQAGGDDGAVDRGKGRVRVPAPRRCNADRDDRGHRGGGHALNDRQTHAYETRDPHALDERRDAAGEKVGVDEVDRGFRVQVEPARDEQRNNDRSGVEGQNMLNGQNG